MKKNLDFDTNLIPYTSESPRIEEAGQDKKQTSPCDETKNAKLFEKKSSKKNEEHSQNSLSCPLEVREKISRALKGKKKNYTSWLKGRTGGNHPSYKHGQSKRRVPLGEELMNDAWIQGISQKWNFCCALTGISTGQLEAHHLNGWDSFPEQRYDLSNGVLLAKSVHALFHKIYGRGKNNRLQFDHFVETYYKDVECQWNLQKLNLENHQPDLKLENILENQKTYKEKAFQDFLNLTEKRGHQYVSGIYKNIHSEVLIYCPQHDRSHSTTFFNYKRSKTGCRCCASKRQSEAAVSSMRDKKTGRFRDFPSKNQEEL